MAGIISFIYYQLYFADAAQGAAAQAANAGDIDLPHLAPEAALVAYPAGVILQTGVPFFSTVPGVIDLGNYTPSPGNAGTVFSPRFVTTGAAETVVTATIYDTFERVQQVNTVTYIWDGTIVYAPQSIAPTPGAVTGKFELAVVNWTGDGTSNRLIPTTFPLDAGIVAIWGVGGMDGVGTTETNFFRHNQTVGQGAMAGTSIMGLNSDPIAGQGIVGFEAGGFRVTAGASVALFANTNGINYSAVVIRDTTGGNYLAAGSYKRLVGSGFTVSCVQNQIICAFVGGTPFDPAFSGLTITDGFDLYTFNYISATLCSIGSRYQRVTGGTVGFTFVDPGAPIDLPISLRPTHVWIWGQSVAYKSTEIPDPLSVSLINGASGRVPFAGMITTLQDPVVPNSFTLAEVTDVNNSVYSSNKRYDYLALHIDAQILAQNIFYSFAGTGAAAPPTVIAGLPFTPGLIFARQGNLSAFSSGAFFRAAFHTGVNSCLCANLVGNNSGGVQGITAIGVASASFGSSAAPATQPFYSWMFKGGALTFAPTYTRNPDPTNPPANPPLPITQPAACVVPILDSLNTALCAAPAPRFP